MESKTQTPVTIFQEVSKTLTDEQILAENYSISQSISKIILKKYARMMKNKAVKVVIFIMISIMLSGCVVSFYDMANPKYELTNINNTVKE